MHVVDTKQALVLLTLRTKVVVVEHQRQVYIVVVLVVYPVCYKMQVEEVEEHKIVVGAEQNVVVGIGSMVEVVRGKRKDVATFVFHEWQHFAIWTVLG
jgi:hypothetical protein